MDSGYLPLISWQKETTNPRLLQFCLYKMFIQSKKIQAHYKKGPRENEAIETDLQ